MRKKKTVKDHLDNKPEWVIELFYKLNAKILVLNKIEETPTNPYIGYKFKVDNQRPKLFVEVHIRNTKIQLHLRRLDYKDNTGISIEEAPDTHKWTLTKLVDVNDESNLDAVMRLVKQSYNDVVDSSSSF